MRQCSRVSLMIGLPVRSLCGWMCCTGRYKWRWSKGKGDRVIHRTHQSVERVLLVATLTDRKDTSICKTLTIWWNCCFVVYFHPDTFPPSIRTVLSSRTNSLVLFVVWATGKAIIFSSETFPRNSLLIVSS